MRFSRRFFFISCLYLGVTLGYQALVLYLTGFLLYRSVEPPTHQLHTVVLCLYLKEIMGWCWYKPFVRHLSSTQNHWLFSQSLSQISHDDFALTTVFPPMLARLAISLWFCYLRDDFTVALLLICSQVILFFYHALLSYDSSQILMPAWCLRVTDWLFSWLLSISNTTVTPWATYRTGSARISNDDDFTLTTV